MSEPAEEYFAQLVAEDTVVVDMGTWRTKFGFAGDAERCRTLPTLVGMPRYFGVMVGMGQKDYYIGDEAESKRGILRFWPIVERSVVVNFDNAEKVLRHVYYNELRVAPEERVTVITEPPVASDYCLRETIMNFFEAFNVPALAIVCSATSSLRACCGPSFDGTALVVDLGETTCTCTPVCQWRAVKSAVRMTDVGGMHLTSHLGTLVPASEQLFGEGCGNYERFDVLRSIKESLCSAAKDADGESRGVRTFKWKRCFEKEERAITIGREMTLCTEPLFRPQVGGFSGLSLA